MSIDQLALRFYEPTSPLSRVLTEAPYLPRCSTDKTAVLVKPAIYAIRYPYMQVNRKGMVSWLIFDLDHANVLSWEDAGLPEPNMMVVNRKNGHSHLFYAIKPVCTTESARSKPIQYMKSIYSAMAARLDADPSYSGPVAKTPGHPWWRTTEIHNHEYELNELADYVDLPEAMPWSKGPDLESVSHSRHCLLFEETRFYAYSIVNREREQGTYKTFFSLVDAYAHNRNNYGKRGFSGNLSISQVKATVRSIARWTWDKYRGSSSVNKGVMRLSLRNDLRIEEKRRLAAERTHQGRKRSTESKVRLAFHALTNRGERVTLVAIAATANLTRQTVAKYKHVITELQSQVESQNVVPLRPLKGNSKNVNYGQHQISAACRAGGVSLGGRDSKDIMVCPLGQNATIKFVRMLVYSELIGVRSGKEKQTACSPPPKGAP